MDDLESEGVDESLKIAIAATRQFKERFERGIVGKILGFSKSGAPSISPELTLDISIGRSGIAGAVDIDKVAITPEAVAATKRYLGRSFTDYVTDKGTKEFNVNRAGRWIENNREVLDQFPELRSQLNDVSDARQFSDQTLARMTARKQRLRDPRISATQRFLNADPEKEIDTVFKSSDPTRMTQQLVLQAKKDTTGEAFGGLKGSYVDFAIEKASIGPYNELGERMLSGRTFLGFINKNRTTLRTVFDQEEIGRMERIGRELTKLELIEKGTGKVKIDMEDTASNILMLINRVGGAQLGRWVARMTGGGTVQTPGIFSERFKTFSQHLTKDRAFQLLHEAITIDDGGKLLRSLLLPIDKPTTPSARKNLQILNKQINLWLIGTGSRVLEDIQQEISENQNDAQSQQEAQPPPKFLGLSGTGTQ